MSYSDSMMLQDLLSKKDVIVNFNNLESSHLLTDALDRFLYSFELYQNGKDIIIRILEVRGFEPMEEAVTLFGGKIISTIPDTVLLITPAKKHDKGMVHGMIMEYRQRIINELKENFLFNKVRK